MSNFFHSQRFCLARSQQVQKHGKLSCKLLKRKMESEILSQVVSLLKLIRVNLNFNVPVYKNPILWIVFSSFKIIYNTVIYRTTIQLTEIPFPKETFFKLLKASVSLCTYLINPNFLKSISQFCQARLKFTSTEDALYHFFRQKGRYLTILDDTETCFKQHLKCYVINLY